jgi:1-acyl-sn-glycerol-3-phosphate acyltransferase
MIQPTPEQLSLLRPLERFWYRVVDLCLRRLKGPLILWNRLNMVHFAKLMNGRRWVVHGRAHLEALTDQDRLIVVANHRTFFDFYVIGTVLYSQTRLSKHILFPVRSNFFYDRWIGGFLNFWMAGFFMFPPILRDKERRSFNSFSLARMTEELERPGQLLGVHPEGTRGKEDDPYTLLPAQPGVGRILLGAPEVRVLPVFILGLSNSMGTEFKRTWLSGEEYPIHVHFGAPIDFDDLRAQGDRMSVAMTAAQRAMSGVEILARQHRAFFEE